MVSGVLETDNELSENAYKRLEEWTARHQGVARSHNPAILEEGLKWTQTSVNAEDAQLLETRKFGIEDVARIYRIPSYKLGVMDRAQFNNVEQQGIDFNNDTILPKVKRLEETIDQSLFTRPEQRRFINRLDMRELMRGDSAARSAYYKERWQLGSMSSNEIRHAEGENGMGEDGDRYYVPLNYAPVDKIDDDIEPLIRSIFDRIETAQRKISERGNSVEDLEKHESFIKRNMEPLIEIYGERAGNWMNDYYVQVLKCAQNGTNSTNSATKFIKSMKD